MNEMPGIEQPPIAGSIIIEWPRPRPGADALQGWATCIYDAATGVQMTTIIELAVVHASADDIIYADAVVELPSKDYPPLRAPLRYRVAEMRIAQ